MHPTLEVRWFGNGTPPSKLRDWLDKLQPSAPQSWTDIYLPSEDAGLNLKVRDDKLQIKRRTAGPTLHPFTPNVSGYCEKWTKWSFDLANTSADPRTRTSGSLWIPVQKTRRQRAFDMDNPGPIGPALPPSSEYVFLVELTTLSTPETDAWTLCVEAEGPEDDLDETFAHASRRLVDSTFPLQLTADESFGYVRWLSELPGVHTTSIPEVRLPGPE